MDKRKYKQINEIERSDRKKTSELVKDKINFTKAEEVEEPQRKLFSLEDITEEEMIENEKLLVKVFNSDKTFEILHDFVLNENRSLHNQGIFSKTKYVSAESHKNFYDKSKNFKEMKRKGYAKVTTPSFAFIKACNDEMMVPNPKGLINRSGLENQINLKNGKVGDKFMKVLSEGLKFSDHINELNLSANRLTFNGVNPLMKSVQDNKQLFKRLKVMDLSYNKIGSESIEKIIKYIQEEGCELRELNLEGNSLGDKVIITLCENLSKYLKEKLTLLNLGRNLVSDDSALSLANIVNNCVSLQVFILCWNHLKNYGASLIINKLKKHIEMKIFDISWNSIGTNLLQEPTVEDIQQGTASNNNNRTFFNYEMNDFRKTMNITFKKFNNGNTGDSNSKQQPTPKNKNQVSQLKDLKNTINANFTMPKPITSFAKELGDYFKEPTIELIHLDISHNNISYDDAVHLSQCVKSNHTILGIHVDGNEMMIDPLGFIYPIKKMGKEEDFYANSQIYYQIGKENKLIKSNIDKVRKIRAKNNCWICEGWRETTIKYYPGHLFTDPSAIHVKLHLNFEDWKPFDTMFTEGAFFSTRMCPPGEVHYFFSQDKQIIETYGTNNLNLREGFNYHFDDEYNKEFNNLKLMHAYLGALNTEVNQKENEEKEKNSELKILDHEVKNNNSFVIKTVGKLLVKIKKQIVDQDYRKKLKYCEPRPERSFNKFIKPRTPWAFPVSIWAYYDYRYDGDTEEYLNEVFNNDFRRCFKEDKDELRPKLRNNYRKILDTYRVLSSQMGSAVWQINATALTEFANICPGLLDNTYVINDVLVKEREVKAFDKLDKSKNKLKTMPDNLVRHQFLSLLVKVASDKYVRTKIHGLLEAVDHTFDSHYLPAMNSYDVHHWRKERYYNEQVDNFFKAHIPILDAVYRSWSNKEPGNKDIWVTLDNFSELTLRLVDTDCFPVREIPLIFNMSLRLQVDEVNYDRHYKMQFYEFLEGLCRVLDKVHTNNNINSNTNSNFISDLSEEIEPLVKKLEKVLPLLVKAVVNPDFKSVRDKFQLPIKDPGTGLYSIDTTNPFYQGFEFKKRNNFSKK